MPVAAEPFLFENTFARELGGLYQPWQAATAPAPQLVVCNDEVAEALGLDPAVLAAPEGIEVLVGNATVSTSEPLAMVYAGHQFGSYSPRLGDGRALLLGEVVDRAGVRRDIHLKGSGRTPFARGGDGKAVLGPMLREYLMGEAMHALGIPTTRGLAVVATGEAVLRDGRALPGALLVRVAASHLRIGTFQYAAATRDDDLLRRLTDYAIARHHPAAADADRPALALFDAVVGVQAELVAQWMAVGFVHGVMNTDNTTISGETIDYGPCAFLDRYDPATVFSSIDHGGRYAYGNQPQILAWNLARLAETLLPLIDDDQDRAVEAATEVLHSFGDRFGSAYRTLMATKLGLAGRGDDDATTTLVEDLLTVLHHQRADYTAVFRGLSAAVRGEEAPVRDELLDRAAIDGWLARWRALLPDDDADRSRLADELDRHNPRRIPRNHRVDAVLTAAEQGDLAPFRQVLEALREPFASAGDDAGLARPAPADAGPFRTYCGT